MRSSTATRPVSTETSLDEPLVQRRCRVETSSRRPGSAATVMLLGLRAARQAKVRLGSGDGREGVLGDDEGAVGREVDRPLAAGLEPVAPPERIARVVGLVRAREANVDLLGRVADRRERELVAGSRPSASAAGAGGAASTTPAPTSPRKASPRRPGSRAPRGRRRSRRRRASPPGGRRPPGTAWSRTSRSGRQRRRSRARRGCRSPRGRRSSSRRRAESGPRLRARSRAPARPRRALETAERDRLGVDRPGGERARGQEHSDEGGDDDETIGRGPFRDQTPGREKESAHRDFDARRASPG